jgi:hypothetical protein
LVALPQTQKQLSLRQPKSLKNHRLGSSADRKLKQIIVALGGSAIVLCLGVVALFQISKNRKDIKIDDEKT